MKQMSTYAVKIRQSADLRKAFSATAELYRNAVGFFIDVCMSEWDDISSTQFSRIPPPLQAVGVFKVQLNIIRPDSCAECPLCRYQNKRYKSICPLTGAGKPYGKRSIACPLDPCGDDDTWEIVRYKGDIALYARCGCGYRYVCSTSERNEDGTWSSKQKVSMLHHYCPSCGAKKRYYSDNVKKVDSYPWEEEDGADNQVEESQY